eukprot:372477-Ditylum_brightwellii.AAC.2
MPYVMDIHCTAFTDEKGIWTVETTEENIYKAMQDVDSGLEVLQITSTINNKINENDKNCYQPAAGAWSQDPLSHMKTQKQKSTNK